MNKSDKKAIKKLEKKLADPDLKKKARKALEAELSDLRFAQGDELIDTVRAKATEEMAGALDRAVVASVMTVDQAAAMIAAAEKVENGNSSAGAKESAKKAKARAEKVLHAADVDLDDEEAVKAYNSDPVVISRGAFITSNAEKAKMDARMADGSTPDRETDEEIRARVIAKREARKAAEQEVKVVEGGDVVVEPLTKKQKKAEAVEITKVTDTVGEDLPGTPTIVDPEEDPIKRDRWGRPLITPPGETKAVGYQRMTTFIDMIDDKTALVEWGRRVVTAGVAADWQANGDEQKAEGAILDRTVEANAALDLEIKRSSKALKKGKIDADDHEANKEAAQKAWTETLRGLAVEAFDAGDGFSKAETGTRIHKLTEHLDRGEPLPDDVTESEQRDLDAYHAACVALNIEFKAVEKFVVLDDLKVGGTLDRLIRYDSPKLGRRVTAIGDVKTGRVDFGAGKMTRQLAGYAQGKGWDPTKPDEREVLRANKEVGLIFHVPAGKGICDVYEIDLKKGAEGLKLCAMVRAHRSETTTAKVFDKIYDGKS